MFSVAGLTLIELLVSICISTLLVGFIGDMYVANRHSDQLQQSLNRVQSHAETALSLLKHELQQAEQVVGTDREVTVRYADFQGVVLLRDMKEDGALYVSDEKPYQPGNQLVISDYMQSETLLVQKVAHAGRMQIITPVTALKYHYKRLAEIGKLKINRYYLDKSKHSTLKKPSNSLYKRTILLDKFELVQGIQQMQLTYSIKENGHVLERPFDEITDWKVVVGVAIHLTVGDQAVLKPWYGYVGR
jgi:type II secretory pathway component PulJ